MSAQPCVFVVDDDPAVRDAHMLLFKVAGLEVEAFASAAAFLDTYDPKRPGCLVLDVNMPGMTGTELQAELVKRQMLLPIIFLTAHGDIPMTVRAIKAGAIEFLTKPIPGKLLLEQVTAALWLDAQSREQMSSHQAMCKRLDALTPRELEVMVRAIVGLSNKEIARNLGISHRTVEIHRSRVMVKTGANTLLELARLAESCGISVPLAFESTHSGDN